MFGKPTVRKAQSRGGNLMIEKRTPAVERRREPQASWLASSGWPSGITGRIRDVSARTRKRADAVR
jgi:hypothetical protein